MTRINRNYLFLLVFISVIVVGLVISFRTVPKFLPLKETDRLLAMQGVTENSAWEPVVRQLDGLDMVLVPAGCFQMGATEDQLQEALTSCNTFYGGICQQSFENELPPHQVCISEPFWIGQTAVTNRQYGSSSRQNLGSPSRRPNWPRESVNWQQAAEFCEKRGARLPTEAEWEYAARAGSEDVFAWGNDIEPNRANCNGCRSRWDGKRTSPVGSFQPNQFALYDTVGNVWEWVGDCWRPNYDDQATGTSGWLKVGGENCSRRIRRGGSWNDEPIYVRLANRGRGTPDYRNFNVGFRLVREL